MFLEGVPFFINLLSPQTHMVLTFRHQQYDLSQRTLIMGTLNVTPDSFSDGGLFFDLEKAVARGRQMAAEGADIIDIGGESTRPGAKPLDEEEELRRVIPLVRSLRKEVNIPISVDTRKSRVAEESLAAGADMINDISALRFDQRMVAVIKEAQVPVVLMHMRGDPETMQLNTHYDNLEEEIFSFLKERIRFAEDQGIPPEKIIIDPGLGFGKSLEQGHNLLILKYLQKFRELGKPVLIGPSRKAFIGRILNLPPGEREEGTMAAVAIAILNGANIVRVHEIARMRRVVKVADAILHCNHPHLE
ncbi:MAG: dihydropteroate synthase [Thermodesulfobacteriota bacterium]